jgi:hypothetical protein
MKRTAFRRRDRRTKSEPNGYLLIIEDRSRNDLVGVFWAEVGSVDSLVRDLRFRNEHDAHVVQFAPSTAHEHGLLCASLKTERHCGFWYERRNAVVDLIEAFEAAIEEAPTIAGLLKAVEPQASACNWRASQNHYAYEARAI